MRKTGFLYDERYLLHQTAPEHPEAPERLTAIYKGIASAHLLDKLQLIRGRRADLKWVETVHPRRYIERLARACTCGDTTFDTPDNQMCAKTFEIALLAASGALTI